MRKIIILACLLLFFGGAARANQNIQGWCEAGAQPVVTSGLTSTTQVQQSFPQCTVTVFIHGGGTATIFADNSGTPLANPFTAQTNGRWLFYAANGRYDVQLSGAGFPSPVTYSDISIADPANQQAALPNTNLVFSATPAFPATNNVSYTMTLTGNVTSSSITGTPANGNLLSLTLIEDSTGGRTFAFPANFNLPLGFSFNTTALATNALTFKFDGTNWNLISNSGSGSGGNPSPPTNSLQKNNGAGALGASSVVDNGADIRLTETARFIGPDPYKDVMLYGGYTNASPPSTTASCNGTTAITLTTALDFQDATKFPGTSVGNGIVVYQCGAATGLTTPPAPTVTPGGVTGGSTTYNYKYVAEDLSGGLTAASPAGTTSTGVSSLGVTMVNLTSVTWNSTSNGEQVYVCSVNPCPIAVNSPVRIDGFTNTHFNGNYTVIAQSTNTFTVYSPAVVPPAVQSETVAATAKLLACNVLTMPSNAVAGIETGGDFVLRYWVYRNNTVAFVVQSYDPYYEDCGMTIAGANVPSYVPSSPGSAVNKYLATTIVSGGGTVNLVVAKSAGNTISGQTVLHDNSQNVLAATNASHFSTPVYINGTNMPFNGTTVFTSSLSCCLKILLPTGVLINQPWVVATAGIAFEGGQSSADSFQFDPLVHISGGAFAYPAVQIFRTVASSVKFKNIGFSNSQLGGVAFETDEPSGFFGLMMDNVNFGGSNSASNINTPAAVFRGITESAIGYPGNRNTCNTAQNILGPPCIRFTTVSTAANTGSVSNVGIAEVNGFAMQGGAPSFQFDSLPSNNSGGGNNVVGCTSLTFNRGLREQGKGAYLRVAGTTSCNFYFRFLDDDAANAAPGNGWVDSAGSLRTSYYDFDSVNSSVSGQVTVSGIGIFRNGPSLSGLQLVSSSSAGLASGPYSTGNNVNLTASGTSDAGYLMSQPAAPTVVLGAGGSCVSNCVAAGTYSYQISAQDVYGNESVLSPVSASVTTDGTKTITISWTPINGQVTTRRWRLGLSCDAPGSGVSGTSYVDPCSSAYTNSTFQLGGMSASAGSQGLVGQQLTLTNSNFTDTHNESGLTGNITTTWPNGSGTVAKINLAQTWTANQSVANGTTWRFFGPNGVNWTALTGPGSNPASNVTFQLPSADSSGVQCISSNGSGVLAFSNCSGGTGTPGGSTTQVQFNSAGSFGGSPNLSWVSPALTVGVNASATGQVLLANGGASGASVTMQNNGATSAYNFNLPIGAGSSGQPLLSGGGGSSPMTFGTLSVGGGGTGATTFTASQLIFGNGTSAFSPLVGSLAGTNPVMTFTSATTGNVPLAVNTPASPTADLFDLDINSVKTSFFDNAGALHTPSTTYTGSGPIVLSGNGGTCPSPATNTYIICLGDLSSTSAQLSNNGVSFKPIVQFTNTAPTAHGVVLATPTFPQVSTTAAGASGLPLVGQGSSSDPIFTGLGVAGGGTGDTTLTVHGVLVGEGTSAVAATAAGSSGVPLLGQGASADPAFSGTVNIANGGTGSTTLAGASIVTVTGVITNGHCASFSAATVITDSGVAGCGGSGTPALSAITAGTASNTINSTIFPQTWNWALTGSTTGFQFGENSAATGSNNIILSAHTLSASTALPFSADNNGNGWQLSSTGQLQRLGTASLAVPGTTHGVVVSEGATGAIATPATGTVGQVLISNGSSSDPSFQDPVVSLAFVNLFNAIAATGTQTSSAVRNPIFSQTGTLQLTWASITGSPATCTLQIQGVDSQGNALNNGSTFSVSPANGTTSQTFTAASTLQTAAQIKAIYACGTYPSTGTLTLDFTPIPNVNVTNTVTNNVSQFGGTNVVTGTGASGSGIPRVTISNDSSLAANQSVNVNQVAGASTGATNPLYIAIADGTNGPSAVKAASTSAVAADKSLVVQLSPNQPNLTSALNVAVAQVGGSSVSTSATGVQKVGVVGNAGGIVDQAPGSAVPANAVMEGLSDGTNTRFANSDSNGRQLVRQYPDTTTTSYHASASFAGSSTTDNSVFPGNATNTAILNKITVTCTQTTAGFVTITLIKRSAADTGGTSATLTKVPDDANYAAAVSAPLTYTGTGPSVGAAVGNLDVAQFGCNASATAGPNDVYIFKPMKPIILRGTAQQVAVNMGNAAIIGGTLTITYDWEETTTP